MFVASPLVGHVLPLIPLATAVREAGHDVVLATAADGLPAARSSGLDVRDVAPGLNLRPAFMLPALRHPVLAGREMKGRAGTDFVGFLFAGVAERMVDGTVALAREWDPDLVVLEPLAVAGAIAAARLGRPYVLADATLFDARALLRTTTGKLGPVARRHGVDRFPEPAEMLVTAPASVIGDRAGRPMRYVPVSGNGSAPPDLIRPGARPRIIVSSSTVAEPGRDRLMRQVVKVAGDAPVDVVLARPGPKIARGPFPPNVRAVDWLPFSQAFPAAAGAVHHGGAGTLLTALASGIPQLVTPGFGDRTVNAELVAARGAGLAIPVEQITAGDLARLVSDEALAAAAREVAEEIAAMPDPSEVVGDLAALADQARS